MDKSYRACLGASLVLMELEIHRCLSTKALGRELRCT